MFKSRHTDFWLGELEPTASIAAVATECYLLPFVRVPDPVFQLNHKSPLEHFSFVKATIEELGFAPQFAVHFAPSLQHTFSSC